MELVKSRTRRRGLQGKCLPMRYLHLRRSKLGGSAAGVVNIVQTTFWRNQQPWVH